MHVGAGIGTVCTVLLGGLEPGKEGIGAVSWRDSRRISCLQGVPSKERDGKKCF